MKRYVFLLRIGDYDFMDKIVTLPRIDRHDDSYFIYAYTDNKKIAKQFEEERDMKFFKKEKLEIDPADDPFRKWIHLELDSYQLNSKNGIQEVIMTEYEHDFIIYESVTDIIHDHIIDDSTYFMSRIELLNEKYIEAVRLIDAFDICDPLPFEPDYIDEDFVTCDYHAIFQEIFKVILA